MAEQPATESALEDNRRRGKILIGVYPTIVEIEPEEHDTSGEEGQMEDEMETGAADEVQERVDVDEGTTGDECNEGLPRGMTESPLRRCASLSPVDPNMIVDLFGEEYEELFDNPATSPNSLQDQRVARIRRWWIIVSISNCSPFPANRCDLVQSRNVTNYKKEILDLQGTRESVS